MIMCSKCYSNHVAAEHRAAESITELPSSKWDMDETNATDTAVKLNYSCYQGRRIKVKP